MSVKRVATRYAKSLLDFANERNELDTVIKDMDGFNKALESRDLVMLLKSPIVVGSKKREIFKTLFEGKLSETTYKFFDIVLTKGRESYLPEMAQEFTRQYKLLKSISTAYLKVASPINDEQLAQIKQKVSASDISLDNVEIEVVVDESIIGGFILRLGDNQYDASVKYRLDKLKKEFTDTSYVKTI